MFGDQVPDLITGLLRPRCAKYSALYPNLQTVLLNNRPNADGEQDLLVEDDLLEFLSDCRALTTLKICYSGFGPAFYNQMATLQSVQNVVVFFLIEENGCFGQLIDFDFLQNFRQVTGCASFDSKVFNF